MKNIVFDKNLFLGYVGVDELFIRIRVSNTEGENLEFSATFIQGISHFGQIKVDRDKLVPVEKEYVDFILDFHKQNHKKLITMEQLKELKTKTKAFLHFYAEN